MASGLDPVRADLFGQTEHALADDVFLDLRGARVDGARARPQESRGPRPRLARRRVDVVPLVLGRDELTRRPEDLDRHFVVALLELGVRELGDGRGRAW